MKKSTYNRISSAFTNLEKALNEIEPDQAKRLAKAMPKTIEVIQRNTPRLATWWRKNQELCCAATPATPTGAKGGKGGGGGRGKTKTATGPATAAAAGA
jgi:hypothetical protein